MRDSQAGVPRPPSQFNDEWWFVNAYDLSQITLGCKDFLSKSNILDLESNFLDAISLGTLYLVFIQRDHTKYVLAWILLFFLVQGIFIL